MPISCSLLGALYQINGKLLQHQYKEHLSDYYSWDQRSHAAEWMVFPENMGSYLSIDETSLSNGELYTIVTNKEACGKKGSIVDIVNGTQAEKVMDVLYEIPERLRRKVKEVTLDMAASMNKIVKSCFPKAQRVIDRFHVQKLTWEAVQELRIKYRWEALDAENEQMAAARKNKETFKPEILSNGDTLKQLLARSRYLLFKNKSKWTQSQQRRADLVFERYPLLKKAYDLAQQLSYIFQNCEIKEHAYIKLAHWTNKVEDSGIKSFKTVVNTIEEHYDNILNFFHNRSTNAAAESFNAKIKSFRAASRGVRDIPFFLFRLSKIYA